MKEIGPMIKQKVMEFTRIWMVHNIKDSGRMINNMAKVRKHGLTLQCMKEIMYLVKSMEKVHLYGQMVQYMLGNFTTIILKVKVNINGQMVVLIMVIGRTIKCMAKVYSHGLMEENTKVIILKIKSKEMALFIGQTAESMWDNGLMENKMEKGHLLQLTGNREKVNGTVAREQSG